MTATDELRRLLDERGIEHMDFNMPERSLTLFAGDEHDGAYTENSVDTILTVYGASPAEAVEATLGMGTCHECAGMEDVFECSACGMRFEGWALKRWARYCPNCGRRIEVDA